MKRRIYIRCGMILLAFGAFQTGRDYEFAKLSKLFPNNVIRAGIVLTLVVWLWPIFAESFSDRD